MGRGQGRESGRSWETGTCKAPGEAGEAAADACFAWLGLALLATKLS